MSNVLAALFGGLGAGASSYGGNLMREQEQRRQEAARMEQLQQQEQARINAVKEQAAAQQALRQQQREAGVNSLRMLFPDQPIPEGDFDADVVMRGRMMDAQNKRFEQGQAGQMERLERTLGARMDQIAAQGDISKAIAAMGNDTRKTIAAMMEKGRNARSGDNGPTIEDFYTKFLTQPDDNGFRRTPAQAMQDAQEAFSLLQQSRGAPVAPAAPAKPAGATLMSGLGVKPAAPALSAQDRQRAASDPAFAAWLRSKGHQI